jgi:nitroreductase
VHTMNPKLQFIFARRSVRAYTSQPIAEDTIRDLLEAAMAAPSAVAKDPWHFYVVRDQAKRDAIANALPNGQMLRSAPVGIVIAGDLTRVHDRALSYLLQDCSAAVENLLLAASTLGLGACWLGIHPREDRVTSLRALFQMPASLIPVAAIALGWPAETPAPRTRYREDAVHVV